MPLVCYQPIRRAGSRQPTFLKHDFTDPDSTDETAPGDSRSGVAFPIFCRSEARVHACRLLQDHERGRPGFGRLDDNAQEPGHEPTMRTKEQIVANWLPRY